MLTSIPPSLTIGFFLTALLCLAFLYNLIRNSCLESKQKSIFVGIGIWMALQGYLSHTGFYSQHLDVMPPRFIFVLGPPLLLIFLLFLTAWGREFMDSLSLSSLTYLHTIRIPVELILFGLFIYKAIPELMTFEGRNLDILAGITAPLVAYWGIQKGKMGKGVLLVWNFICLALLFNIVIHAILSIPTPFQQFAFDQPNIGVLHFPFVWLPAVIVPIVLFSHLVSIRKLMR